ncbi:MAG: chromosomal replication initiator protein DnaA [Chloroflexota bacterium]|nr:chromosomal replication initiator protein DnaA [Chloroflexota bacterium]
MPDAPSCVLKRGACYLARPCSLSRRGAHGRAGRDTGCFPTNIYCGVGTLTTVANAQRAWEAALGRLEVQVPRPAYNTWLRGTVGQSLDADRLVVAAPSAFIAEHLNARMRGIACSAVHAVVGEERDVAFVVGNAPAPQPAAPTPEAAPIAAPPNRSPLNPRYTFEAFVEGTSNRLAFAAAQAVADAPGDAYNPLVVYGAVGLGKTHLLHAIGHHLHARGRAFRYVTSERLVSDYTAAVREGRRRIDEFNLAYRSLDALLIDDIQFLAGKQGTQETFFHIFNALHDNARQIVVTSDWPPSALRLLDDRLRSRLEWGLVTDVSMPDPETRAAILQRIANRSPVPVPPEIITALAQRNTTCIRQLEGSLGRVVAAAQWTGIPLTLAAIEKELATYAPAPEPMSATEVIARVSQAFGLPAAALTGKRRDRKIARARHIAACLLAERLSLNPVEIGELLGNRDRATIAYAIRQGEQALAADPEAQRVATNITQS